jgi:hypothetical protein
MIWEQLAVGAVSLLIISIVFYMTPPWDGPE